MPEVGVRLLPALGLLCLASCVGNLTSGRDEYSEGMRRLRYDPASAEPLFSDAERDLAEALAGDLDTLDRVSAVTMRVRCLIELERHADAAELLSIPIPGYKVDRGWRGDAVGLSLLRASRLDPERGYAELLLGEKKAATERTRLHLAWEQVHLLKKLGTAQARAEGVKICDAHAGKLDFDALKQSLVTP